MYIAWTVVFVTLNIIPGDPVNLMLGGRPASDEVRENVRKKNWVGSTVFEICEEVENEIKKRGAKCAFPVNTSINEVAAHYTAEPNDELTISDTDLVKIDLGAQINGYIADTAVTVCYDSQFDMLVQTAEDALNLSLINISRCRRRR